MDTDDEITPAVPVPSAAPSIPDVILPQVPGPSAPPQDHAPPPKLAPHVNLDNLRAAERRAWQEIEHIETVAREGARSIHPLTSLLRHERNKQSVKRTRHWRKEVDDTLITEIERKVARNRDLDRQIEELEEECRQLRLQADQVEKLSDCQPNPEQREGYTPGQTIHELIAEIEAESDSPPQELDVDHFLLDVDVDAHYQTLTDSLNDYNILVESSDVEHSPALDCEDMLSPTFLPIFEAQEPGALVDPLESDHDAP